MSNFKSYLVKKNQDILNSVQFDRNTFFRYRESDALNEIISAFSHRTKKNKIRDVLVDLSITFESLLYEMDSDSNHEDLIEVGYLLGLLQATHKGCIYSVEYDNIRYYFVGVESDILMDIRKCLRDK